MVAESDFFFPIHFSGPEICWSGGRHQSKGGCAVAKIQ